MVLGNYDTAKRSYMVARHRGAGTYVSCYGNCGGGYWNSPRLTDTSNLGGTATTLSDGTNVTPSAGATEVSDSEGLLLPEVYVMGVRAGTHEWIIWGRQIVSGGPRGGLHYNDQIVRNPAVRAELEKLRDALDDADYYNVPIIVTGGESVFVESLDASVSLSTGEIVEDRLKTSAHNVHKGSRDVDLRMTRPYGIRDEAFRRIVLDNTAFRRIGNAYKDGHWHLGLPRAYSCPVSICSPP